MIAIPKDITVQLIAKLKAIKDEQGNRKYNNEEISRILLRIDQAVRDNKIKITPKHP